MAQSHQMDFSWHDSAQRRLEIRELHPWKVTASQAQQIQLQLAHQVDTSTPLEPYELIAGADVSYDRGSDVIYAGVVVCRTRDLKVVEKTEAIAKATFPYVPGLLSFREAPAVLEALGKLRSVPDVLMLDGQGLAHPRRFGLACHIGLLVDLPALGCAKSRLYGRHDEPAHSAGSQAELLSEDGDVIGMVVRTRSGVQPVYVSVGHKIDLASAVRVALETTAGYRIPEPTRQAHLHVNQVRQAHRPSRRGSRLGATS